MTKEQLDRIHDLLFIDELGVSLEDIETENKTPSQDIEPYVSKEAVEWTEEELRELAEMEREERERAAVSHAELVKANELFEQLNWIVLPDQKITSEDLIHIAKQTLTARGKTQLTVDHERMINLLKFRDTYGGTLYRSAERTLGDSNNLYFVLKFEHPGDEKTYAIAENVVYGNATYVLREDILPLMDGETVLTAVKLPRNVVRGLGAKRLNHIQSSAKTHPERITDSLVALSNAPSVM